MRSVLFLFLCTLCSFARADTQSQQYLHEISTRAYLLCSSAMVYFNPQDRTPDPRSLTAYFDNLNVMETKIIQLGQPPELNDPLKGMQAIFKELDNTPRSKAALYPDRIGRLLKLNVQLQEAVGTAYKAELKATPSPVELLNEQSQAMAHLLMDYQLRRYPLPDKTGLNIDPTQLQTIDSTIDGRFSLLLKKYPDRAAIIDKVRKNYQFVRPQLLQAKGRPNGGAEFYMTRSVIDLSDLAFELAMTQEGQDASNPQNL